MRHKGAVRALAETEWDMDIESSEHNEIAILAGMGTMCPHIYRPSSDIQDNVFIKSLLKKMQKYN